jgi:hypothetical protein
MAVDIQKLFNEELPAAIERHPDQAREIGAKYQINISGEGGGSWFIDVSDTGPGSQQGEPGGADCVISVSAEDFQRLHENPQANGAQLLIAGRLQITGNQLLAMKLQKLFSIG